MSNANSSNASGATRRPSMAWESGSTSYISALPRIYGQELNDLLAGLSNHDPKVAAEVRRRYDPRSNPAEAA